MQATTRCNIVNRQSRDSSWHKSPKYAQKQRGKQAEGIQGHWHKAARHIRHIWTLLSDEGWAKMAAGATRAEVLRLHRRGAESPCGSFWLRLENLTWWFRFESWETRAATFLNAAESLLVPVQQLLNSQVRNPDCGVGHLHLCSSSSVMHKHVWHAHVTNVRKKMDFQAEAGSFLVQSPVMFGRPGRMNSF